jgi:hypothetical protein
MIGLKELTFANESIKHLRYKTLKYTKVDPCVRPKCICSTIYTLFLMSFEKQSFTFNELHGLRGP